MDFRGLEAENGLNASMRQENCEMEKRKEKRFVELDDVLIKDDGLVLNAAKDGVIYALTRDISLSGARIISEQVFPVGCHWRMLVDLKPSGEYLRVDAKVVWLKKCKHSERFHIGVELLHRYPDTIRLLIKHLYGRHGEAPAPVS
jgi:Tfp pilus assembly protein PilZ